MTQKEDYPYEKYLSDLACNFPEKLPRSVKKIYKEKSIEQANQIMPALLFTLIKNNKRETVYKVLPKLLRIISKFSGIQFAYNLLSQIEVIFRFRKPSIGIYDHTFHLIGGGQKYGCTIAYALQNDFNITLISNKEVKLKELKDWYNMDLSNCKIKIIKIPFFEERGFNEIDPWVINSKTGNPFHIISKESGNYDIFINNSMLEMVYPLSNISIFVCHFPERRKSSFFYVDRYDHIVYNSKYTAKWIKKKWNVNPTRHIYPPVDMVDSDKMPEKENIILSVARFEIGGSKQQLEMIKVFSDLYNTYQDFKNWHLILVGGSIKLNPYLEKIKNFLASVQNNNIILKVNISIDELKSLYKKAKIFWHFCGLNQIDPALVEHFGMSIVEGMQNWCVPIVFDGGGQREIVENGFSGYRFSSIEELKEITIKLIRDQNLFSKLSKGAHERGKLFTKEVFIAKIKKFFEQIINDYTSLK